MWGTSYGQGLLDLVQAFERIQRKHLVQQAVKLGYRVDPTLYVDDVSAEVAGPDNWVEDNLVAFPSSVCNVCGKQAGTFRQPSPFARHPVRV